LGHFDAGLSGRKVVAEKTRPWWKSVPEGAATSAEAAPAPTTRGDLADGESREVQGSGANRYTLRNVAGTYSCTSARTRTSLAATSRIFARGQIFRNHHEELARVESRAAEAS
jgi:hypothetical protein